MNEWIIPIVSLVLGLGSSYIAFFVRFNRFTAMDSQREKDMEKWRDKLSMDMETLKISTMTSDYQVSKARLTQVESFIDELRDMKHTKIDPYIPFAFDDLKDRLDRIERFLNGNLTKSKFFKEGS